jgi:hypothetical protein
MISVAAGARPLNLVKLVFLLSVVQPLGSILCLAGSAGTSAGALLQFGGSARAAALADSETAVAEDVFGAAWNPAALGAVRSWQTGFSYNRWMESVGQQQFVWGGPAGVVGGFALSVQRLATGEFQGFDAQGTPTSALESESLSAGLSWGRSLSGGNSSHGASAGISLRHLREDNAGARAASLAGDVGFLYRPGDLAAERVGEWARRASFGAAVRHLGKGLRFDRETAPLPLETAAGIGYSHFFSGDVLTAAVEARRSTERGSFGSAGVEYWHRDFVALRGGFQSGTEAGPGLRFGAGLRIRAMQIDYAWTGLGEDLGSAHRVSLLWRWAVKRRDSSVTVSDELYSFYMDRAARQLDVKAYDQAVLDYNRALEIRPDDPAALEGLMTAGERMRESP